MNPILKVLILTLVFYSPASSQNIVNDVTQLNPIRVDSVLTPTTLEEIIIAVKNHEGTVSIGGGRYSMGGQTATEQTLHIDMRQYNQIINFSQSEKEITVQAGITWRKIQEHIDPYNLSVRIMQTYANFTVGGSLSVNVHGRYIGEGPIVLSVKQIKIVLANGDVITASATQNKELFYGAIGGYGALGIIAEVTLRLTDNCKIERTDERMPIKKYKKFFFENIRNDSSVIFHNADIYPNRYKKVRAVSYIKTNRNITIEERLKPVKDNYRINKAGLKLVSEYPGGKWIRQHIIDPITFIGRPVQWRNYEASYDVKELEPKSRKKSTYVLQEYFVPVDSFNTFYPLMAEVLRRHKVNVINISIRHAQKDPGALMTWAQTEVFAFVLYYKQRTSEADRAIVKQWTRELTDAVLLCNGSYYLPYQIHATPTQFARAYPHSPQFFELKKQVDPTNKFKNKLLEAYYPN